MADADSLNFNALDMFLAEKNHKSTEKGKLFFLSPNLGFGRKVQQTN